MKVARRRFSQWVSRLPLRRKLQLKSNLIAVVAALVVSAIFAGFRLAALRNDYLANSLAITQLVAENATGAVAFEDPAAVTAVLATLRATRSVTGAVIDLPRQNDFATYGTPPTAAARLPDGVPAQFDGWILNTAVLINDQGKTIASLQIVSDLRPELWVTMRMVGIAFVAALVLAIAVSHIASNRLRQVILHPIEALHGVAQRIGNNLENDYRAPVTSTDELGELTMAFNQMLDRLQAAAADQRATNISLHSEIAERRRLEKALVDTSRQAGMAEVATGILHNVGNVLNSVNISAQLLRENLERSQLPNLVRAADMIKSQGDHFARFVADDAKGRLLPTFIVNLSDALSKERLAASQELGLLAKNIEHIKEIVSAQQGFAKMIGVTERVTGRELFDEAERIAEASVLRHGVEIERHFAPTPPMLVDRHRTLQILVNFITNAIHAVKVNTVGNRRVTLTIALHERGVAFSVADNGVGIAAENLNRIFTHGFTTRRDGHGFGLHSGAIAAKQLDGEVRVQSEGAGRGATFVLELPLEPRGKSLEGTLSTTSGPFSRTARPVSLPVAS